MPSLNNLYDTHRYEYFPPDKGHREVLWMTTMTTTFKEEPRIFSRVPPLLLTIRNVDISVPFFRYTQNMP